MRAASLALIALLPGCAMTATMVTAEPVHFEGQDVVYKGGAPIVMSRLESSDVVIAPRVGPSGRYPAENRIFYMVAIRNRSPGRIEISEASFSATANGSPTWVVRAVEIEDAAISDAAWAQSMNAFAAGVAALGASYAGTTTRSGTARVTSSTGHVSGTVKYAEQSYNRGQAVQAQRQVAADARANSEAIQAREQAQLDQIATLIRRTTLEAGEPISGIVVIEAPRYGACGIPGATVGRGGPATSEGPCSLRIQVRVGADTHSFGFEETFPASKEASQAPKPSRPLR
jgi:hypothetical protein